MSKRLAPLLPAGNTGRQASFDSEEDSKRKRIGTDIACNACRRRKTRCDGIRPACAACRKRSTDCTYVEKKDLPGLRKSLEVSQEVLELLTSASEPQAFEILRMLRQSSNHDSVLNIIKSGLNGSSFLSDHDAGRTNISTQSPLEIELTVKYPVAYPTPRYPSLSASQCSTLLKPSRLPGSRSSDLRQPQSAESNSQHQNHPPDSSIVIEAAENTPHIDKNTIRFEPLPIETQGGSRRSIPSLCDERLRKLKIDFWTDVSVTNDFAARIISMYLTTDHPLLGIFDPHLFLTDLVGQRHRYCSRLLVNALMYWGCQMYTAIDETAAHHVQPFCEEAERLWLFEKNDASILTAVSAQLLSLAYLGHGKDHNVLNYLAAALQMGTHLSLFGKESAQAQREIEHMPPETRRANSYAAWGIFNWGVLATLFYRQPGLKCPVYPPVYPVPVDPVRSTTQEESDRSSSEVLEEALPSYMGRTFPALCKFWRIIHDVSLAYYKNQPNPLPEDVSPDFAEFKFRELLAWSEGLSSDQMLRDSCPHHVVVLHIWFHAAILDIFRPFVRSPRRRRFRLKTFATHPSPEAVFNTSVSQLKQLVVRYRCDYDSSAYTLLWQSALIYLANEMLHETTNPEWRFYFLACIYGYEGLQKSYRVAEVITRGLLTMMLKDRHISVTEARQRLEHIRRAGKNHATGHVRATFMVDLDLAMMDPDAAKVENLAGRFEEIALFQDLTSADNRETAMGSEG